MALNTAEAGIPEEVLAGWRSESGHRAEENFESALVKQLGVEPLKDPPSREKSDRMVAESRIGVMRSSPREDFEKGVDFYLFNPLTGRMVPIDISVSNDPAVHAEKRTRELSRGTRFLPLSARGLERAARGGEKDLLEVRQSVNRLLLSDALDQGKKGDVPMPPAKLASIERKLAELQ